MNKPAYMTALPLLASALLAPMSLHAATPINETRPLNAEGEVSVSNIRGLIRVVGSDRADVRITGSLGSGAEGLEIKGDENALSIEVDYPDNSGWSGWWGGKGKAEDTTLIVEVPRGISLEVDSISAKVEVESIDGAEVDINAISAAVNFSGEAASVEVDIISGDVTLDARGARRVEVESVSGDARIDAPRAERIQIEAVSGDIELRALGEPLQSLQAATVSGRLTLQASVASAGEFRIESMSGDVELRVPGDTSARVRVESFSGDINSMVGKVVKADMGPGSSLETTLGDGKGRIRVESFSGDVRLKVE